MTFQGSALSLKSAAAIGEQRGAVYPGGGARSREIVWDVVAAMMQAFGKAEKAVARTMSVSSHVTPMSIFICGGKL